MSLTLLMRARAQFSANKEVTSASCRSFPGPWARMESGCAPTRDFVTCVDELRSTEAFWERPGPQGQLESRKKWRRGTGKRTSSMEPASHAVRVVSFMSCPPGAARCFAGPPGF